MEREKIIEHLDQLANDLIEFLPELPWEEAYFAGGCIRDLVRDRKPKDYDVFFPTEEAVNKVKSYIDSKPEELKTKSTRLGNYEFELNGKVIQLITCLFGPASEVVHKFDFTINSNYYLFIDSFIWIHPSSSGDFLIPCQNISKPLHALYRLETFFKRGYTMEQRHLVQMVEQISGTTLSEERLAELTMRAISGPRPTVTVTTPEPTPNVFNGIRVISENNGLIGVLQDFTPLITGSNTWEADYITAENQMTYVARTSEPIREVGRNDYAHIDNIRAFNDQTIQSTPEIRELSRRYTAFGNTDIRTLLSDPATFNTPIEYAVQRAPMPVYVIPEPVNIRPLFNINDEILIEPWGPVEIGVTKISINNQELGTLIRTSNISTERITFEVQGLDRPWEQFERIYLNYNREILRIQIDNREVGMLQNFQYTPNPQNGIYAIFTLEVIANARNT